MANSSDHLCPGGCPRHVPRHRFACPICWRRLPTDLRAQITATYRVAPSAHLAAMVDARRWYRENPVQSARGAKR